MTFDKEPKILVVDDEYHIRQLIGEVLRRNNYIVHKAADGQEALDLFHTHNHDVVITDIRMPVMDGLELMKRIKDESPFTEVIVITGHASRESAVKALNLGAFSYFVKPFESLEIIPLLTLKTLQHQRLLRENKRLIELLRSYLSEQQQELIQKNEQVEKAQDLLLQTERLSAQGRLASGLAHELGGPLGVIETTTQYLLENEPDMGEIRECLEVIQERVEEMSSFIIDLLEVNRNRAITFQRVMLHEQISKMLRFLKQKIKTQNIQVKRVYSQSVTAVELDVGKFNQVLLNLFLNSLDAMASHNEGILRIKTETLTDSNEILIHIEDSGPGIPEEEREKIFTPFFSKKSQGTGLGLAITQQIINDHGGVIFAGVGTGNQGARFTIKLPVSRNLQTESLVS